MNTSPLKRSLSILLNVALLLGALLGYDLIMEARGGFSTEFLYMQWLEFAAVICLYLILFLILRPSRWRPLLAAAPIFMIYIVHDIFFLVYGKVFRLINLVEIPELLQILPWYLVLLLVLLFVVPLLILAAMIDYRRPWIAMTAVAPLVVLAALIRTTPDAYASGFESLAYEIVKYSDGKSVERNGRLAMLLYREAQRTAALEKIGPYHDRAQYEEKAAAQLAQLQPHLLARDVHLIVLESFLDPRLFERLRLSRSPVHPDFEAIFGDTLGLTLSPVFGGATAQAEFEILCGVPAFEKLSSVEFNVFTGAPAHCLPGSLTALGYRSVASNAYKPNFFNAQPAYQGMGFAEQQFPVEFYTAEPTYLRFGDPGVEEYIFDGDLMAQNLAFVQQHLAQHPGRPLFNYLLTMYGHTPHPLDPAKRPEIIQMQSDYSDDHLQRVVNQFYYRTEAIAHYVNRLIEMDPDSLIVLVADHVPPLRNGPNTYKALHYMGNREQSYYYNRIAVIANGKPVKLEPLHHYELPDIVFDYLSGGHHCKARACTHLGQATPPRDARLDAYLTLMAHAAE